ncbi:MAG TPA: hypothetical protein VLF68_00730, partial [Candidatus Saccharimonadales bacterium]|nr:hypothetical protein [Candidatus Saccharimonadales bacterium]
MKPARILSVIFNPLIVLSLLPFVVTLATGRLQETIVWTLLLALCMVCIAVYVWYGTKKKFFSDFDVTQKSQRGKLFVGYAVAAIFYLLMLFVFHGPVFLKAVLLATIAWLG